MPPIDRYYLKKGDTAAPWAVVLEDGQGTPQDLAGCTVTFSMRTHSRAPEAVITNESCDIIDATLGIVQYTFSADAVATEGTFECWFTVTFPNTKPITFPAAPPPNDYNLLFIQAGSNA